MSERVFDFRSDTVTRPTAAMLRAMTEAELGDDVLGDDPTVRRLQEAMAKRLEKEAALFFPSGTMSNLAAVRVHCRPGDEMICETDCHIVCYEQGGYVQINGVIPRMVQGDRGVLGPEQVVDLIRPSNSHFPRTRLVTLENTHNRGGGRVQPLEAVVGITQWAREAGLATHLDGARLFNAQVATDVDVAEWASHFDTVSICFSKGLGAPVGSVLVGTVELIAEAHRHRKVFGGGMRQSGVLAAAALYALDHHVDRLAEDHANAQALAEGVSKIDELSLLGPSVDTNMVFFDVSPDWGSAAAMIELLARREVLMLATGRQRIRAVTHLDVDGKAVVGAIQAIQEVVRCGAV